MEPGWPGIARIYILRRLRQRKGRSRRMTGSTHSYPPTNHQSLLPTIVPAARMMAFTAIEPTYCELIITSTVRIAQLACSRRNICVESSASTAARPSLMPYRNLKSSKDPEGASATLRKGGGFSLSTHNHGCAARFFWVLSVGPTSPVMAAENGLANSQWHRWVSQTWMRTGKRAEANPIHGLINRGQ